MVRGFQDKIILFGRIFNWSVK